MDAAPEILHVFDTSSCEHSWQVMPILDFYRDSNEIEKKESVPTENATTKKEFQGECIALGAKIIVTQPLVADWSETVQVPQCQSSNSLMKTKPLETDLQLPLLKPLSVLSCTSTGS